mgnify:CR=1 FL=1
MTKPTLSKQAVRTMFATLLMAGCRPPETWATMDREAAVTLWHTLLSDLTDDILTQAVIGYMRSPDAKWWPTAGALLALTPEKQLEQIDDSDEAWSATIGMIRRYGRGRRPPKYHNDGSKHARIKAGIGACGGWVALCNAQESTIIAHRASFRAAYRSCKVRAVINKEQRAIETVFPMHKLLRERKQ